MSDLTADVVIIGGGPAGTAALWGIGRAAPNTRTILIEKSGSLGSGSSTASLENYRTCWATPCIAQQMQRSVEVFHHADEYLGEEATQSINLKQQGYLFCSFTDKQADTLRNDVVHLHKLGLNHVEYLDKDELRYRFPWLSQRVIAAKYDPIAGWLDSHALIQRYAHSSPTATLMLNVAETSIRIESGRVVGVKTSAGEIAAPRVVIANGANAISIGRTAGVELPIIIRPRQSFTTSFRHEAFPSDAPMLIGAAPYPHVRPEAGSGAIFGWEYTWNAKHATGDGHADALRDPVYPLGNLKDPRFPSIALALLARQFGEGFDDPRYLRGIHHNIGYYVYRDHSTAHLPNGTPYHSERAILDEHPAVSGLFLSIAHVGHGIMTSPASGEIIASKVLGLPLPHPRFAEFGLEVAWVEHDENAL
jgi:glycine/D-amino acid oxidase-like deaminating enzyme